MKSRVIGVCLGFIVGPIASAQAAPVAYVFSEIARTGSDLDALGPAAINNAGDIAFLGLSSETGLSGYYLADGSATRLIIDTSGPYGDLSSGELNDAGQIALLARLKSGGSELVLADGLSTVVVADTTGPFSNINNAVSVNNAGVVAFRGFSSVTGEVTLNVGAGAAVTTLFSTASDNAMDLRPPDINSLGKIAFRATGSPAPGDNGIFAETPSDSDAALPVATVGSRYSSFGGSGNPSTNDDGQVIFFGDRLGGGAEVVIATPPPGFAPIATAGLSNEPYVLSLSILADTSGIFSAFSGRPLINNNGDAAFFALHDNGKSSVSVWSDGVLSTVLTTGDMLDGLVVASIFLDRDALNDFGQLALLTVFEDGSSAIIRASISEVPLPAALPMFLLGLAGEFGLSKRKARRKKGSKTRDVVASHRIRTESGRNALAATGACLSLLFGAPASATTITFDDLTPGAPVTGLSGLTITPSFTGFNLFVATGLQTASGANYLGVDDGGSESFLGGDSLTFTLSAPTSSFSLTLVTTPAFPLGAVTLSGGGATATTGAPTRILSSGDELFVLSIFSPAGFTSALLSADFGVFAFNIDDIMFDSAEAVIPLPGALWLFLSGVGVLASRRRRLIPLNRNRAFRLRSVAAFRRPDRKARPNLIPVLTGAALAIACVAPASAQRSTPVTVENTVRTLSAVQRTPVHCTAESVAPGASVIVSCERQDNRMTFQTVPDGLVLAITDLDVSQANSFVGSVNTFNLVIARERAAGGTRPEGSIQIRYSGTFGVSDSRHYLTPGAFLVSGESLRLASSFAQGATSVNVTLLGFLTVPENIGR